MKTTLLALIKMEPCVVQRYRKVDAVTPLSKGDYLNSINRFITSSLTQKQTKKSSLTSLKAEFYCLLIS